MKRMTLAISVAVLALTGAVYAQEQPMRARQPETRAEAQAHAGQLFDKLDLNHDGKLDQADRAARVNMIFDRLDTNHDGMISRDEFAAAHAHGMGHEHEGADHPGMAGDRQHGEQDHPHGPMGHWGHEHREMKGLVMLILLRADPDHTGIVTRDAFIRAALSLFDQADTNHDGVLTPEEHRAAAEAMRQQMGGRGSEWHRDGWHGRGGPDGAMPPPAN